MSNSKAQMDFLFDSLISKFKLFEMEQEQEQWPQTNIGRRLRMLDDALSCPICASPFNNPFALLCGHVFCSLCIRKHLDKSYNFTTCDICPSCREAARVDQLRPVKTLAAVIEHFAGLRQPLLEMLRQTTEPPSCNSSVRNGKRNSSRVSAENSQCRPVEGSQAPLRKMPQAHFHGLPRSKVKEILERAVAGATVQIRLDGDKEQLEWRHRELVHLYNAQIGSSNPLTLDEVIRQVNKNETAKDAASLDARRQKGNLDALKQGIVGSSDDCRSFIFLFHCFNRNRKIKVTCSSP